MKNKRRNMKIKLNIKEHKRQMYRDRISRKRVERDER